MSQAPAPSEPAKTAAGQLLRETMQVHSLPSISVAVSVSGRVVFQRALGVADVASGRPATPETVYAQGSVTKSVTAVAALMLAAQGRLNLDATVQEVCPAFPPKPQPMSVRQLLAHTAGVRHYDYRRFAEDYLNSVSYPTIEAAFAKFADDPLVARPGERYHYSSWGYVVVACAIEGASGVAFDTFIAQRLLAPAGMEYSRVDTSGLTLDARASGYSLQDDGSLKLSGVQDPSDRHGASGLLATPTDMVRFADALMAGRYLDAGGRHELWSPQPLAEGEDSGHGMGWDLLPLGAVGQGGTAYDASSYLYLSPPKRVAVAVATNRVLWSDGREELARKLAALFDRDWAGDTER